VLDLMIHDIDLVHTLVGGRASSVIAVGVPVLTPFVDIANARLTFRLRRGGEHHGEPRVARADAQAAHLPAERLSLARSGQR
jgi:predicted dehydrogenase